MSGLSYESLADMPPAMQRKVGDKLLPIFLAKTMNTPEQNPVVDGIKFKTRKQALRYMLLREAEEAGKIFGLTIWQEVTIRDGYTVKNGKRIKPIRIVADFAYWSDMDKILETRSGILPLDGKMAKALEDMDYIIREY